jgi:arylsulfatase A-like enzyme
MLVALARLAIATVLFLAACGEPAPKRPPNLFLISIDALRADRLEPYGYDRPTSPFLAELAAQGLVFENAFVNTHGTTQSHTTMLSGLYQEQHGVGMFASGTGVVKSRIPDSVRLLPEILRDHGYSTIGVTDRGNAAGSFGFSRGFDRFDDRGGGVVKVARRVLRFVEEATAEKKPLFVFLHTYEVHSPYRPPWKVRKLLGVPEDVPDVTSEWLLQRTDDAAGLPPGQLEALSALYDAEIRHTDDRLRELFADLEALGFFEHAVVLVTSDHGEEFGEHGGLLHRGFLYDVLLRVPLILRGEGVPPGRSAEPVSTIDITPTLLGLAGLPPLAPMEGSSLLEERPRSVVVSQYSRERYAIRTAEWKLVREEATGSVALFAAGDTRERDDVAERNPEVVKALTAALDRWLEKHRGSAAEGAPVELTNEEWRELASLGYLR